MDKYKISIVIPVYNNEEYIDDCMASIINQSIGFKNLQVILINDGSVDNSLEVMQKYNQENVLIVDKENTGVSDTRNIGMSKAIGKYILFLDSDDYLSLNACSELYNFFERHYNEVDLVTYPIIYDKNGKLRPHKRYINQYELGSGIYDLDDDKDIIQTTINVIVKNELDNNTKFDVNQKFSEDERFSAEILMKKKKIGFCKDAEYFYRRHSGTATNTIINPLYSFDMTIAYYEELFKKYKDNNGVYKYIQRLYLNNIGWRIKQNVFLPVHLNGKNYDNAVHRIKNLVSMIDVDVLGKSLNVDIYHKFFLLKLINRKINIKKTDNEYVIDCGDIELYKFKYIDGIMSRFKLVGNKIELMASVLNPMFDYVKPKLYIKKYCNGKQAEEMLEIISSNESYYKSSFETTKAYGFDISIDFDDLNSFKFFIRLDRYDIPVSFSFGKFASNNFIDKNQNILYLKNTFSFGVDKLNIINRIKSRLSNLKKVLVSRPKACLYRIIYYFCFNNNIWLYNDDGDSINNAYYQFLHDFEKNDGINRYYVSKFSDKEIDRHFDSKYKKYLIKWGSLRHKIYYLKSKYIFTSYVELKTYCPFNNAIKYYNDLTRYKLIYLQHGVLHEDLIKTYAKEFTEIDKFVVSTNFEKTNLVNKYHYKEKDVLDFGMTRFSDRKINDRKHTKSRILFVPSWRSYLIGNNKKNLKKKEFLNSSYYKEIFEFLHSLELKKICDEKGYILDFKSHPLFRDYDSLFKLDNLDYINLVKDNDIIVEDYNMVITDFSSFQFDFVKLKKPIIYFLPDKLEFDAGLHIYRELDLKYEDSYGVLCLTSKELLKEFKRIINDGCKVSKKYLQRMDECFLDISNPCEDIYNYIINNL